jgi:tetratricopeptide (TPR) repeat protein/predicted Ser/Thr protein kinase
LNEEEAVRYLAEPDLSDGPAVLAHLVECSSCASFIGALAKLVETEGSTGGGGWRAWSNDGFEVPGYSVGRILGRGGMGLVYEGRDERLDRRVAIKRSRLPLDRRSDGLEHEAAVMAQLSHPNVAEVFDVGMAADGAYVVMEYVEGVSLRQWCAPPRTGDEIVAKYIEAARGLAAVHDASIVHGDFKPSNALVTRDGDVVKVVDFGLARSSDVARRGRLAWTQGTPRYMAPEQYDGGQATARSDQFSFCVSLFEALCGELPYPGADVHSRRTAWLYDNLKPVSVRVSRGVERALVRGLHPDPARRFPSMHALLDTLERRGGAKAWMGAAVVVVAVSVASWTASGREAEACADGEASLRRAWSPERRPETTRPELRRQFDRLDVYAQDWIAARRGACEARADDPVRFEAQAFCLERLSVELERVADRVREIATADKPVPSNPLGGLEDPSSCLTQAPQQRGDGILRDEYDALHQRFVERARDGSVDNAEDAELRTAARDLLGRAQELGDMRTRVRILLKLGRLSEQRSQLLQAEREFEEALFVAEVAKDSHLEMRACEELVLLLSVHQSRVERARYWAERLSLLANAAERRDAKARAELAWGWVEMSAFRFEAAEGHYTQALAQADVRRSTETRLAALEGRAQVRIRLEKVAEAKADAESLLEERILEQGPDHPRLVAPYNMLAVIAVEGTNDLDEGARLFERALSLIPEDDVVQRTTMTQNLGALLAYQERHDEALALYRKAEASNRSFLGETHPDTVDISVNIVTTLVSLGRNDEARSKVDELLGWDLPPRIRARALLQRVRVSESPRADLEEILATLEADATTRDAALSRLAALPAATG